MAELNDRSVSIGRIFNRAFGVMGNNPGVVFGVALILGAGPQLLYTLLVGTNAALVRQGSFAAAAIGASLLMLLISIVSRSLVAGCITRATVAYSQGRRASLGECLSVAISRFVPVIAVSFLFGLAVMLGMVLLIVPGVMLAVMWAVVVPVTVEERTGIFGAFGRSQDLTRGARWKIFGLFLLLLLIAIGIGIAAGLVSAMMIGISYTNPAVSLTTSAILFNVIVTTIASALWASLQTALFVELREWKDGPMETKLGEIFE
ncbi:MAG: hypothetical protein JF628_01300 [Sphingomonas sp.]|nr:hypothetical protein [Sphingomonas sp.]